jgi:hypothetical protein
VLEHRPTFQGCVVPRWTDPAWLAEAYAWIGAHVDLIGAIERRAAETHAPSSEQKASENRRLRRALRTRPETA